ncbi:MAG: MBL fold metallo-hydrolase [Dehalococcoidia bacterium]|nr:MBL fold metallo-hydrolase [Dehalococcoidia bacterium]
MRPWLVLSEVYVQAVFKSGVYLPDLDLWLDSTRKREFSLISHAHSDHTGRHNRPVLTPNTAALLGDYLKNSDPVLLPYHQPFDAPEYTMTLYPAGHCLGSAQALIESKATGERLLYTGDIKSRTSPINEPLEAVLCDTLVMEATYGRPEYVFPPEEQVLDTAYKTLRMWLSRGDRPVVQGWRLGKSQELLHHLLGNGFDVLIEESIYLGTHVYLNAGVKFPGQIKMFEGEWPDGWVLLFPPGKRREALKGFTRKRTLEMTGWATSGTMPWGRSADASLPYSDHPDFNELVAYVEAVAPKQVYTVNGFPELAAQLRELGYPAVHLPGRGQKQDTGFQMKLV